MIGLSFNIALARPPRYLPLIMSTKKPEPVWFLYLLRCRDDTLYTGITTDLNRRLTAHNSGKGAKYTRSRLPVVLAYSEELANESLARRREYEIKGWSRAQKERFLDVSARPIR